MDLFEIDRQKCLQDGICAAVCPVGAIELDESIGFAKPSPTSQKSCIRCGHCVCACPVQAFLHKDISLDQCFEFSPDILPSAESVEHFFLSRRSIRVYKDKPVPEGLLERLIHISRYAPTAHNSQPVCWTVVRSQNRVGLLAEMVVQWMRSALKSNHHLAAKVPFSWVVSSWEKGEDVVCRNAPHVIIAHAPEKERASAAACIIALSYLELAAYSFGLGACWAGFLNLGLQNYKPLQEAVSIPEDHLSFGSLLIGYPRYTYHRLPPRKHPKITWI